MYSFCCRTIGLALMVFICIPALHGQPDTLINRYATSDDAAYWSTVNEGDYLIFAANNLGNTAIYFRDDNPSFPSIATALGKKIHIWRGEYSRIYIEGGNCVNSSSQPTIITNLGGQVKVGHNPAYNYRSLTLKRFDHLHLTGRYDPVAQTGDPDFLGHNDGENLGNGSYYEEYGIWAYPRFVAERTNKVYDNSVRISDYQSLKIDYVASFGGGFACFNLKTQSPANPGRVTVDVQDCFAGFCRGEGFYVGKTSGYSTGDIHHLTMRNNIVVAAGAESFQTGVLGNGSVIEHNVGLFSGAHFRRPFQKHHQDHGHQITWVEGGISVNNNLLAGIAGHALMSFWVNPGSGRAQPSASDAVSFDNNYYGFARTNLGYMNNTQDGVTPIEFTNNYIGPISTPASRDGYLTANYLDWDEYSRFLPCPNPLTVTGNQYPSGRPLFDSCYQNQQIVNQGNVATVVAEPSFVDVGFPSGFDYRNLTIWSAKYEKVDLAGQYIPYQSGDMVYYFTSEGHIQFFECLQAHSGEYPPTSSPSYWQQVTWNGRDMPPLDVRLMPGSDYQNLEIGLTYEYVIPMPDTLINRYATSDDAAYWSTVNEGDYLIFAANNLGNTAIYFRDDNPSFPTIATALGKKIHIWRGEYSRIYIEGGNCVNSSSQPTIITNLGGQVKVGHNPSYNYRSLTLKRFDHLHLTGKYDPVAQTGDPDFLGHNDGENLGNGSYYEEYGIWAYPRFVAERTNKVYDNSVRISDYQSLKIDYVASFGGGFACFNLKTQSPANPGRVTVDVQDCFAGFCRGEGFYVGKTSGYSTGDIHHLTMRNNIVVAAGAESFQTGVLGNGSVIEHNVGLFSGAHFRRPFQKHHQDHGHQITWVEGGISVNNNLLAGIAGHALMSFWVNPGSGRAQPSTSDAVSFDNNYYGFARTNLGYMNNTQDGVTPIEFTNNYIGPISTPASRDGYLTANYLDWDEYSRFLPCPNPLTVTGNQYPSGRPLFDSCYQNQQIVNQGNVATVVAEPSFVDVGFPAGFDYRNLTIWSAKYEKVDLAGQYIPYQSGDIVYYFTSEGHIQFFECLQAHSGEYPPTSSPSYWQQVTWNGRDMPPLDVRQTPGSVYDSLGIGLEYGMSLAESSGNRFRGLLDPMASQIGERPAFLKLVVYTNPILDQIEVTTESGGILEIWNMHGQRLFQVQANEETLILSSANLATGMYLIRLEDGSQIISKKILIRR